MQSHGLSSRRTVFWGWLILAGLAFAVYFLLQGTPGMVFFSFKSSLAVWSRPEERIRRPAYVNSDHGFCGPCPTDAHVSTAWQLTDLIARIGPKHPFLVNIGAASTGGGRYDPTYPILIAPNSTFAALLVDPHSDPLLFDAYPKRENVQIKHDYIWSETVVESIFQRYRIPRDFALLKIDIDSYECSVLEKILQADYRPDVIHTEFNPIFPPPVIFRPIYHSETKLEWTPPLWNNVNPFYGCSLTALSTLLSSFGYVLLQVEFWDAIYVQYEIARSASLQVPVNDQLAYEEGFLHNACLPYCRKNVKLVNEKIAETIEKNLNRSNFTETLRSLLDTFAPRSSRSALKHPYLIKV